MSLKKALLTAFLITLAFIAFSLETIEAPFVSKLAVETSNGKILLTWQNPSDFNDNISIYRSTSVIDSTKNLLKAEKIAYLTTKEEKYIDTPTVFGGFYYAVIITSKTTNEDSVVLVPYRNYTLKPAVLQELDLFKLTAFSAGSNKSYITLRWEYATDSKSTIKVMLFRNTEPIVSEEALSRSLKIVTLDIGTKLYVDIPVPNIFYYYAIFIEGDKMKSFVPNVNISTNPVMISEKNEVFPDFNIDNFIPLPLLAIKNDPKSGKYFLDPQILKNPKKYEYNDAVKSVINDARMKYSDVFGEYMKKKESSLQRIPFRMLPNEDIYIPAEYAQEYSSAINFIKNGQTNSGKVVFEELIKEILPDDLLQRVAYYLGQLYYMDGDYYISYVHFSLCYETFKKEILPYLDSIYFNIFEKLER